MSQQFKRIFQPALNLISDLQTGSWLYPLAVIFLILVIWLRILFLYGCFAKIKLQKQELSKMIIVYKFKEGKSQGSKQLYQQIAEDAREIFKISKYIGIFYDDPVQTAPAKCRSIIGVVVNPGQQSKLAQFLNKNPNYYFAKTRQSQCYSCYFPYINRWSFNLVYYKIYTKILKLKQQESDTKFSDFTVQIFNDIPGFLHKEIKVATLTENFQDFDLWKEKKEE